MKILGPFGIVILLTGLGLIKSAFGQPSGGYFFSGADWKTFSSSEQTLYVAGALDAFVSAERTSSNRTGIFNTCFAQGGRLSDRSLGQIRAIVAGYVEEVGPPVASYPMSVFVSGAIHRACQ